MGRAFSVEWARLQESVKWDRALAEASAREKPLPPEPTSKPYPPPAPRSYRNSTGGESIVALLPSLSSPPRTARRSSSASTWRDDGTEEAGTEELEEEEDEESLSDRDRAVLRVLNLVEEMKREPEWYGTAYDLLSRNCNHFTNELCYRLTGRRPPAWISARLSLFSHPPTHAAKCSS
jgi:hypothetical protein